MDFGRTSIDNKMDTSSDESTEETIDTSLLESIDTTGAEEGKCLLTNLCDKEVVLGEPEGQQCNSIKKNNYNQGVAIPDKINLKIINQNGEKFPLQDYLNPGRTYSNRFAIRLPENKLGGSNFNFDFLILVRQNPFWGSLSEHPLDHIEKLEDLMEGDYNRCILFSFSLAGDTRRWLEANSRVLNLLERD